MKTYHAAIRQIQIDGEPYYIINAAMDHWRGLGVGTAEPSVGECIRHIEAELLKDYPEGVQPSRIEYPSLQDRPPIG